MATADPIYDLKKGFLSSQLRILNGSLEPRANWQDRLPEGEHGDLPEGVVNQVLYKLNVVAKRHQKIVYSSQALRHVAEQIDDLYWGGDDIAEGGTREDDVLRRGADLKDPRNVEALPESFPAESGDSEEDLEQLVHQSLEFLEPIRLLTRDRYQTLKAQLSNLSVAVQAQRQRRAYYAKLKSLIEPFANPQESVQPNLVTKDSQLATELEHTRILAAKLAYQIEKANFPDANRIGEDELTDESAEDQLRKILDQVK